jgi:hypothetical protein
MPASLNTERYLGEAGIKGFHYLELFRVDNLQHNNSAHLIKFKLTEPMMVRLVGK